MLGSNEVSVYRDAQLGWILCSQSEFIGSLLDLRAPAHMDVPASQRCAETHTVSEP